MATHRLESAVWQSYFNRVSRILGGKPAEIETASLKLGARIGREWTPLNGLVYDPKDDTFEVVTDDLDHLIQHPQDIYVDETGTTLRSVEIIDAQGNHQIVRLKQPLPLRPPS